MDAQSTIGDPSGIGTGTPRVGTVDLISLGRWAAVALAAMLPAGGAALLARRISGAFSQPLDIGVILAATCALTLLAMAVRGCFDHRIWTSGARHNGDVNYREAPLAWWIIIAMPAAAALLFAIGLSIPGTSAWALMALWGLLIVEETWSIRRLLSGASAKDRPSRTPLSAVTATLPLPQKDEANGEYESSDGALNLPAADVTQLLSRRHTAEGSESLRGWLRAEFPARTKTAQVHVAFCPPFRRTPHVFVEQADGPAAIAKVAQAFPYGTRIEVKLVETSAESGSVLMELVVDDAPVG